MHEKRMKRIERAYCPKGLKFPLFDIRRRMMADHRKARLAKDLAWGFEAPKPESMTFVERANQMVPRSAARGMSCQHGYLDLP